ncbi:MAG: C4-dicarboxylate ABC transporter substrate-binding protein [Clostridiales bacterium]|nr:MAG: C4-dicarboxylate ABC transporter substrate-binding protein [Clostridiales bacterium]
MKKGISLIVAALMLGGLMLGGCAKTEEPAAGAEAAPEKVEKQFVTIATGGSSGAYFALGGMVSTLLNENLDYVNASVQSTGASAVNATLLGEGKADLAFAMNDVVNYAYTGTELFSEKGSVENLRGVASLYPNFVQAITLESKNINDISELKGKRVGVGAPGSGTEVNARQILSAYGITYDDIDEDYLSYAESVEQLKNGAIDAAFLTSGIPNAAIMDLATTKDVKIIPIKPENIEELAKEFPFYSPEMIPAGTYDNEEDVETAAVMTLLVTRAELSEDTVYDITKTIFENLEALGNTHASGKKISLEKVEVGMPIPLHPGAQKYYDENK